METSRLPRTGTVITGLALAFLTLVGLWVAGRLTKTFDFYITPTSSNLPTFWVGDHFFASRFWSPDRLRFIAYHPEVAGSEQSIWMHRVCGLAGDTVEIRNGALLLNGQSVDAGLTLAHQYTVRAQDYRALPAEMRMDSATVEIRGDSAYYVHLADAVAAGLGARRQLLRRTESDNQISQKYGRPWNADHFGPFVVPAGSYFVLGDNRRNAMDSRYTGCVKQQNVVGTVLGR